MIRMCSVGHHSTSDDSFAYRPRQEVEDRKRIDNPIARFRLFLHSQGWWSDEEDEELKDKLKKEVMNAFKKAESEKRHPLGELFEDVYGGEEPWNLVRTLVLEVEQPAGELILLYDTSEGAKGGVEWVLEEVWWDLGAVEE